MAPRPKQPGYSRRETSIITFFFPAMLVLVFVAWFTPVASYLPWNSSSRPQPQATVLVANRSNDNVLLVTGPLKDGRWDAPLRVSQVPRNREMLATIAVEDFRTNCQATTDGAWLLVGVPDAQRYAHVFESKPGQFSQSLIGQSPVDFSAKATRGPGFCWDVSLVRDWIVE